ncbi:MAG: glycoside hydrolase family 88 protein [Muribaculaceae bacterium]|nr:glycoside hydrolase family 88 protein [Muribaculaceae bacterium]
MKHLRFLTAIAVAASLSQVSHADLLKGWSSQTDPVEVGRRVAQRFVEVDHPNFDANPAPTREITYPETCAWLGALRFAAATSDTALVRRLEERLIPIFGSERHLQPMPDHVDHTVFGSIPLQLYVLTGNEIYGEMGLWYADSQWAMPRGRKGEEADRLQALLDDGLSWQTRYWIDDMYMISAVQTRAYLATGNSRYIDRAARQMVRYLDKIQCDNGLFYHAPDAPFHWARGNGWMAAGMTELLNCLPENNPDRKAILEAYRKMMSTLKQYQRADGLWGQLIDEPKAWSETSGSAMFVYAMISGVRRGWLSEKEYEPVVRKAWEALVAQLDENADIAGVCEGTNRSTDRDFYLNRRTLPGNMHGQAPMLWCATAFLDK